MNDDIDPETRELLRAMHREVNGLKPRRARSPLTYAANRRPAGEGGAASRAGSRSRGTTPIESRSSEASESDSDEDADGSAAVDASSAEDGPRNKRKERSPSARAGQTANGRPPKRVRRPSSGEPDPGTRFDRHAAAAAAHVKAAAETFAPAVREPAEGEAQDPSLATAQPAAAASDRCKCFVAGVRFGASLPRRALGSQGALASALAAAFGSSVPPIARSALDASRVTLLGGDGRCWGFPRAGSIGSSPAWSEAQQAAVRIYVG